MFYGGLKLILQKNGLDPNPHLAERSTITQDRKANLIDLGRAVNHLQLLPDSAFDNRVQVFSRLQDLIYKRRAGVNQRAAINTGDGSILNVEQVNIGFC